MRKQVLMFVASVMLCACTVSAIAVVSMHIEQRGRVVAR